MPSIKLGLVSVILATTLIPGLVLAPIKPIDPDFSFSLPLVYQNSLIAISSSNTPETSVLANLSDLSPKKQVIQKLVRIHYPDLYWIVDCESDFNPKAISYAGWWAGMGLCQIVPSTLRHCENKLGRKLDIFDPIDNLDCGDWLLKNEGLRHWQPSRHCWSKYLW